MNTISEWSLIERGEFEEACRVADQLYQQSGSEPILANKAIALLNLKKFDQVVQLGKLLIDITNGRREYDFIIAGIANWLMDEKQEAIQYWQEAQSKPRYTDAAGGVEVPLLLYYAGVRLDNTALKADATRKLKKRIRNKQAMNWPGPLAAYVVGELDEHELLLRVSTMPILQDRELCQAYFWIGVQTLDADPSHSKESWNKAIDCTPACFLEFEYYLAKDQLGK